jgi:hypothetical protein
MQDCFRVTDFAALSGMKLANTALPGLYRAADKASLEAQRRFLIASQLRLGFWVVAAAGYFLYPRPDVLILRLSPQSSPWLGPLLLRSGY